MLLRESEGMPFGMKDFSIVVRRLAREVCATGTRGHAKTEGSLQGVVGYRAGN